MHREFNESKLKFSLEEDDDIQELIVAAQNLKSSKKKDKYLENDLNDVKKR